MRGKWLVGIMAAAAAGCGGPDPSVTILDVDRPYTNSTVTFTLEAQNAERVELLRDGVVFATATSTSYTWDTTAEAEGSYEITARATAGKKTRDGLPVTVVVDRTAPTISARVPAVDATGVWVEAPITVTFSEPIETTTVDLTTVTLSTVTSGNQTATVALDASALNLTVTMTSRPAVPTDALLLLSGLTDLAGNPLGDETWSWKLPSWAQLGDGLLVTPGATIRDPAVASGTKDYLAVAWVEDTDVYVHEWDGSGWQMLGGSAVYNSSIYTSLAVGTDNLPVIAYLQGPAIAVQRWDGSTWNALGTTIASTPIGFASHFELDVAADNTPYITYLERTSEDGFVERWNGSAWVAVGGAINNNTANVVLDPHVAVDGSDRAVVTFAEVPAPSPTPSSAPGIEVYVRRDGAMLGGALNEVATDNAGPGSVTIGADGNPIVLVIETGASPDGPTLFIKQWTGTVWNLKATIQPKDLFSVDAFGKVDSAGDLFLSWNEQSGPDRRIKTAIVPDTGPVEVSGPPGGPLINADLPAISVGADGRVVLAYNSYEGAGSVLRVFVYNR